ncbi:MAG: S8 family serine peptidase, partial [Lapillicoccus sp.]
QALNASGSEIHLVAPGQEILGGGITDGLWVSDVLQSGTSGASAVVAGQLALMKQRWPGATGNQLLFSLLRNTIPSTRLPVWDPRRGFGALDFAATLTVDPRSYPDVQPLYGGLATVHENAPATPRIPTELGADGQVVVPGASSIVGAPSSVTGSAVSPTRSSDPNQPFDPTQPSDPARPSGTPASTASAAASDDPGSLAGWVTAAVLVVAAVASLVIIRRRSS